MGIAYEEMHSRAARQEDVMDEYRGLHKRPEWGVPPNLVSSIAGCCWDQVLNCTPPSHPRPRSPRRCVLNPVMAHPRALRLTFDATWSRRDQS